MEKEILEKTFVSLKRFLIRTKVTIEDVSEKYFAEVVFEQDSKPENALLIEGNHLGQKGIDLYLRESAAKHISNQDKMEYERLRVSYGVVSVSMDLTSEIIPQEANLEKNAVSFSKGCYLGQELVCRIDSREASTPFSFFAVPKTVEELPSGVEVTSSSISDMLQVGAGPFDRIIRVQRKLSSELGPEAEPVSGYFSV